MNTNRGMFALVSFFFLAGAPVGGCVVDPSSESREEESTPVAEDVGEAEQALDPTEDPVCWKQTSTRGVGLIPSECPGMEKDGLLCYPWCKAGYDGVGPVCWEICPPDAHDDGAFCRRDAKIISSNNNACPWYDKCGLTFAKGCSKCPTGYINDGCTCRIDAQIWAKKSYGRGAGTPMQCPATHPDKDAGLCYKNCSAAQDGVGPVCWYPCPATHPVSCGAGCAVDDATCAAAMADWIVKPIELVAELIDEDPNAVVTAMEIANAYALPICN